MRICVGEDDLILKALLECILENEKHDVRSFVDGEAVLTALKGDATVDAVLLDLNMPERDGLEIIHWLRVNRKDTPVILMTGDMEDPRVLESMKLGVVDLLAKPFRQGRLLEALAGIPQPCARKNVAELSSRIAS